MDQTYRPPDPYVYHAAVARVVTPKTYDLKVDLTFNVQREVRLQLRGIQLPDGYEPGDDHPMLTCVMNWFQAAAAGDYDGPYPLWIRTYKHADPSDAAEPGEDLYEADIVRKTDADNLRVHLTNKFPDAKNGVSGDQFSFFKGRGQQNDNDT